MSEGSKIYQYRSAAIKEIDRFDFSTLWLNENYLIIGIIGNDYQRLDIKYLSITKDAKKPNVYHVKGKSKIKNNICEFQGKITIFKNYRPTKDEDADYLKEGCVIANSEFFEKAGQANAGVFKGVLRTYYAIDKKNNLVYPDDGNEPDTNLNNGFVGTWTGYHSKISKLAHWGADFVPLSTDLNVAQAIGDFIPKEKYQKNGWNYTSKGWKSPTPEKWWK